MMRKKASMHALADACLMCAPHHASRKCNASGCLMQWGSASASRRAFLNTAYYCHYCLAKAFGNTPKNGALNGSTSAEGWDLFSKKKGDSISSSKPFLEDAVRQEELKGSTLAAIKLKRTLEKKGIRFRKAPTTFLLIAHLRAGTQLVALARHLAPRLTSAAKTFSLGTCLSNTKRAHTFSKTQPSKAVEIAPSSYTSVTFDPENYSRSGGEPNLVKDDMDNEEVEVVFDEFANLLGGSKTGASTSTLRLLMFSITP
ncbi:hypothetical protein Tco_0720099, partial [Tanacetum coccineum]